MNLADRQIELIEGIGRKLLFIQNRDPYSETYGCFDRRYWAWKICDYPEATYQRNIFTLAWLLEKRNGYSPEVRNAIKEAVRAGLEYTIKIQHADGSFDQAFPNERSFGATAFLLHPLLSSLTIVEKYYPGEWASRVSESLRRSAEFLVAQDETHGFISNHLAGAALSLLCAAKYYGEERYIIRAEELISLILKNQSEEGWFLEYDGADPGYQTLCIYYLAQYESIRPYSDLAKAISKAVEFVSWFVHPDGSFSGEYGSRRTSVCYLGGLALLGRENSLASAIVGAVLKGQDVGVVICPAEIDIGNLAPLTVNHMLLTEHIDDSARPAKLPWQQHAAFHYFTNAGIVVRSDDKCYAVLGMNTGGVLKVFDKKTRHLIGEDCGYVGSMDGNRLITTQITQQPSNVIVSNDTIEFTVDFYRLLDSIPSPLKMVFLRMLNLTLMPNIRVGNWIKSILVRLLISGKKRVPIRLSREVCFLRDRIVLTDKINANIAKTSLIFLERGRRFVGVHMASSRYFPGLTQNASGFPENVDVNTSINVEDLAENGFVEYRWEWMIDSDKYSLGNPEDS